MILLNRKLGDYRLLKIKSDIVPRPGQCFKIAGLWMTAATWDNEGITFLCQDTVLIQNLKPEQLQFSGPIGSGFSDVDASKALVVAGGTGIAAVLGIMAGRKKEQETHLVFYSKQADMLNMVSHGLGITDTFENLNRLTVWNTIQLGRPVGPLDPFVAGVIDPQQYHVFVAGPSSLMEAARGQCQELGVPDCNFHTNF